MRARLLFAVASLLTSLAGCSLVYGSSHHTGGAAEDAGARDVGATDTGPNDAGPNEAGLDAGPVFPDGAVCDPVDHDGDGFSACAGDCDDADATRYPDAPPICGDGIVQSCTNASRSSLRSLLGRAAEVGVFRRIVPITGISGVLRPELAFAISTGFSSSYPTYVSVGAGDGATIRVWAVNPIVDEAPDVLGLSDLFTTPPAGDDMVATFVSANDYDGRGVFGLVYGALDGDLYGDLFLAAYGFGSGGSVTPTGGPFVDAVSVSHGLRSERGTHVLLSASFDSLALVDGAEDAPAMVRSIPTGATSARVLRGASDGTIVVQGATDATNLGVVRMDSALVEVMPLSATGVAGPLAPIGGDPPAFAWLGAGGAIGVASSACSPMGCTANPPTTLHSLGDSTTVTHLEGAPIADASGASPALRGHAVALVEHTSSSDTLRLAVLRPSLMPVTDTPTVVIPLPSGVSVRDLGVGASEQQYTHGGTQTWTYVVVVGALLDDDSILVSGFRACEAE